MTSSLRILYITGEYNHLGMYYLLNTPSIPDTPMPSSTSLVSLKGTVSGVGRIWPCSKAIPIKVTEALHSNITVNERYCHAAISIAE
jgi:hypothetical protein